MRLGFIGSSFRLGVVFGALLLGASCNRSTDTLATFDSGTVKISDLDAYLLSLPENQRQIPAGIAPATWMENKIRRLALERVLERSEAAARLEEAPGRAIDEQLAQVTALTAALARQLSTEAEPDDAAVQARLDQLASRRKIEPLLNFQHIYFRLDLAKTPAERESLRAKAEAVAAEAKAGGDFPALARQHSQSSDAARGGMVVNARPSDLDEASRRVLEGLAENEVSGLVETRSGLHIFRLVRRLVTEQPPRDRIEAGARSILARERLAELRQALLRDLREHTEIDTDSDLWRIGSSTIDADALAQRFPDGIADGQRDYIVDQLLLAEEARARGLQPPDGAGDSARLQKLDQVFNEYRRAFDSAIDTERLRSFYDAQPTLFSQPEKTHLELIFIEQGNDSFNTLKIAEAHVAELRAGTSFAELARRVSTGPQAQQGGDLGPLSAPQLARLGAQVASALGQLEVGQISDPIYCTGRIMSHDPWLLRGGFAIVRVRSRTAEQPRSFDDAIDDVRRAYAGEHRADLDRELQAEILEEAGLKIHRVPDPGDFLR